MDHQHPPGRRPCDHDDDVLCHSYFFDRTLHTHLARKRLNELIDGKRHWVFAMTPECGPLFLRLRELLAERDVQDVDVLHVGSLPLAPIFVCVPRDQLALDDLSDMVDFSHASREVYESRDYIAITSLNTDVVNQALSHWITLDHLVN